MLSFFIRVFYNILYYFITSTAFAYSVIAFLCYFVYQSQTNKTTDTPNDVESLINYINNFSIDQCKPHGNHGYKRVLLQLFGYSGHGKSSFINTCKYVLHGGKYHVYADAASSDGGSTKCRISYPLTRNITMVDNRGCPVMSNQETGEIYAQLGNLLPLDKEVKWHTNTTDTICRLLDEESENDSDFVIPIFVYSAKRKPVETEIALVETLLENAKKLTGIIPFVVLTHQSHTNRKAVEKCFENMGRSKMFKVENYTAEDHSKIRETDEAVLKFLYETLKDAKYQLTKERDPKKEKSERKKFVYTFLLTSGIEEEKANNVYKLLLTRGIKEEKKEIDTDNNEPPKSGCYVM
ncbi:uncharacterized protein LOC128641603 [Bombina bombina]|uniref:uncharacterized protein LOC128641603 n=1 Tax=Bombina bombina TaxID=8345 RepID=UPI00235A499C|nr:uncharacterized protein LOC128641603 [Bombina bombina]